MRCPISLLVHEMSDFIASEGGQHYRNCSRLVCVCSDMIYSERRVGATIVATFCKMCVGGELMVPGSTLIAEATGGCNRSSRR